MNKKHVCKWVNVIALGVLVIGGINYLFMGLFEWDFFAAVFGGSDSVVSRIFYSLFGIAAITLICTILWRAFKSQKKKPTASAA